MIDSGWEAHKYDGTVPNLRDILPYVQTRGLPLFSVLGWNI